MNFAETEEERLTRYEAEELKLLQERLIIETQNEEYQKQQLEREVRQYEEEDISSMRELQDLQQQLTKLIQ